MLPHIPTRRFKVWKLGQTDDFQSPFYFICPARQSHRNLSIAEQGCVPEAPGSLCSASPLCPAAMQAGVRPKAKHDSTSKILRYRCTMVLLHYLPRVSKELLVLSDTGQRAQLSRWGLIQQWMAGARVKLQAVCSSSSLRMWPHRARHLRYPPVHCATGVRTAQKSSARGNTARGDKGGCTIQNCPRATPTLLSMIHYYWFIRNRAQL